MCENLDTTEETWKRTINKTEILEKFDVKITEHELDIKQLNETVQSSLRVEDLEVLEEKFKSIKVMQKKITEYEPEINFNISNRILDQTIIGDIKAEFLQTTDQMLSIFKKENVKTIELPFRATGYCALPNGTLAVSSYDFLQTTDQMLSIFKKENVKTIELPFCATGYCALPNGTLAVSSYALKALVLFDKNFNEIKRIEKLNGVETGIWDLDTNGQNEIYISITDDGKILKTDMDFNFIAKNTSAVKCPQGICFFEDSIFICDWTPQKIVKLNRNLKVVETKLLMFNPIDIKVQNNIACVTSANSGLYFYDLSTFQQFYKDSSHSSIIGLVNSCFIDFYFYKSKLNFYDENGKFINEIVLKRKFYGANLGSVFKFKNKYVIGVDEKMIIFSQ